MPTCPSDVKYLVETIVANAQALSDGGQDTEVQRQSLIISAEKLAIATREPAENVYHIATQTAQNATIRSAIAMGVFDVLPKDGSPMSIATLSDKLSADPTLLARIMRACSSTHFFQETSSGHYSHNDLSRAYLVPENRNMTAQMYDFTCKGVFALPEFGTKTSWKSNGTYEYGPFQLGANTDLGFWEYLQEEPERMKLFNSGMRSQTTIGSGKRSGIFPFDEILTANPCTPDEIAVVDVGGGRGQFIEAVKHDYPNIQGRLVLQDQESVIEDAKAKGLPEFIEPDVGNFFEVQHIKGARIYHFRRIFHDWNQEKSKQILQNTRVAMDSRSRVVIADMALPDVGASRDMALQDINMLSFGGMERTESQWAELIESAGLRLRKIWKGAGGAKHSVVEAVLPDFQE